MGGRRLIMDITTWIVDLDALGYKIEKAKNKLNDDNLELNENNIHYLQKALDSISGAMEALEEVRE